MHQLNDFEYFSLNSPQRGSNHRSNIKFYISKHKRKYGVALLLIIMILIVIYFLKFNSLSKLQKSSKAKRSVNSNDFKHQDKINVEVIPQNKHPNHRYIEKEPINKNYPQTITRKDDWPSEPFDLKIKINKQYNPTQDIMPKEEFNIEPKELNRLVTNLGTSMRLKGVYIKTNNEKAIPENQLDGKYLHSNEINNLMLNNFNGGEDGNKLPPKSLRSNGVPFQPPSEGWQNSGQKITQENLHLNKIFKTHPITMYLEFYPMNDLKRKFKPNSNVFKHPGNKFHTSEINYSFNAENINPPQDNRNRMIMKLNLYPKELNLSKTHLTKQRRISRSRYNINADRKSFGWFFKQKKKKKKNPKECSILRIHPHGKRITAKWKNEKGEWIHADHVEVKNSRKKDEIAKRKKFKREWSFLNV